MHLRKLVIACGFASLALSNFASALGLGEVKLKSTLNQPLSAEVQLLDTKGLSSEQIIVSLASSADFERNGLDFVHFYTEFRFEVALDNPGGPVVLVTSTNPVREPFLNFLVEAKWTSGRLLREYTLLMDLPTFDDKAPVAVQAAQGSTQRANPASRDLEAEVQAAVDAASSEEKPEIIAEQDQPAKKSKVAAGTYGPVGGRDTLWDIALAVRPDSSASVHQTMLALQRLNPQAFIRGNINLLKKGQVLRVPEASEITSISQPEAVRQFNAQVAEWSENSDAAGLGAPLDASRRSSSEQPKSEAVAGRVKLEAPTSKDKTANGQGSGANKGSGKALETELAATLEELEKAKSEKTELSSRVHDLEEQVKTMQRLVDVSNEKLRALQLNSAKQPEQPLDTIPKDTTPKPEERIAAVPPAPVETPTSSAEAASSVAAEEANVAAASSAPAVAPPPKKVAPKPLPKPVPKKTIVDHLRDNILYIGLGAAALLAAIALVVVRRRKAQAEETQSYKDSGDLFDSEPNFDAFNQPHEEEVQPDTTAEDLSLLEEDTTAVAETGDVVGEADIYIAYGKFDQAEEMLLNGLAKDPSSTEIRLKLLEVYSQTQNLPAFDKHYAAILPLATGFALSRASELRANIPGAGEFSGVVESRDAGPVEQHEEEPLVFGEDFNLDLDDDVSHEEIAPESQDLSFDLDLEESVDVNATTKNYGMDFNDDLTKPAATDNDEFLLDFDLDETAGKDKSSAEDLSEISLALDGLDDDELPDDIETGDNEFNFDFSELEDQPAKTTKPVDDGDDFDFESDVNKLDLAALDNEMAGFDAELDKLDEESFGEVASGDVLDDDLADLDENLTFEELESLDNPDTDLDLDEGLVELDDSLETDLDESDLDWDDELETATEFTNEDLSVEDDFDIDAPASQDLHDLDVEFAENVDDESAIVEEDLTFAELDELHAAKGPASNSSVAANEFVSSEPATEDAEDDLFEQALSDFSAESLANDPDLSEDDLDAELDFMADADEAATKLDLARAYIDMGDSEGARDILAEVAHEGNEQQRQEAVDLLSRIDA
ncbi:MAG: FimV/HubP family polar landmark protein [Cellvibrio sp.]